MSTIEVILSVVVGVLALFLLVVLHNFVHNALEVCCLRHANRFCRHNGFAIMRFRCGPAFDQSGIKTEFTLIELDCLDDQKERRLFRLLVWVFGIRKVLSDEKWHEPQDDVPKTDFRL